ncbi:MULTISPECIES: respiratory nitrate reductase subunit gamma [Streptomyces]|uniref:Nitrate reductase-like protein NarX n=6 Tax=Streptomyces rimosus TaxID=1927 RepID=L8EYP4_STRR1|nr:MULTISPECIES: respiratory nitrate reductase subunit gamma [Streptomyces]KOG75073.1 nitrate reductase [Kitasatospora aureofaciens]MYT45446.1 respiratory nitrate reductase subunit gamma [Streptomyces sp. SID5471]KUJ40433.1 nitrate reductase [Streptomyces rimosus subsp. rimosus]QDA02787.1 respiratory nitrate reductase subunit gamma [Streptomyces rimosus]QEV74057.1 respiratory nitrate reductase subunit gamma [Streptomyces rimosus]
MTHAHIALWGVLPYLVLATLVAGTAWRYRYDRFGFTTRSSQLHESRLLRIGGPLFHYALFLVIGGHVMGLLVPEALTERLRVSEHLYHLTALTIGGLAGLAAVAGLALLLHRRLRVPAVRAATSRSDRLVYPLLAVVLLAGLLATASTVTNPYDYRLGVSVWFRSLFALEPDVGAMARAPFVHQLHALLGMALFALWPFSRLVHAFTVPLGYLFRPYVVYRSRGRGPYRRAGARQLEYPWATRPPGRTPAGRGHGKPSRDSRQDVSRP